MKSAWRGIRIALVVLCAAVFVVSGAMLIKILIGYAEADKTYESINEGFETLGSLTPETDAPTDETDGESDGEIDEEGWDSSVIPEVTYHTGFDETMQKQYDYLMELKKTYPEVVGYISIPSVSINYPVVQTTNNDYYLNHLITGEESKSGAIYLDYRINANATAAKNTVLYGHNMNDGSMFHNVELLFTLSNFLEATVEYICEDGILIYKPLAVYRADAIYPFGRYQFEDEADYVDFCRMVVEKSHLTESADVTYASDSSLITLATCTNSISSKTGRYVYQAVLDQVYLPAE